MADSIAFIPPIYHVRERLATTNVVECRENITPVNSIADRLKKAREAAGLTQPELATRAGVSQGTIGNVEAGLRKQPRGLLDIARALNVSPQWLATGTGPMRPGGDASAASPQPPTLQEALHALALALRMTDEITLLQARPLLQRMAEQPEQAAQIAERLHALLQATRHPTTTAQLMERARSKHPAA